MRAINKLIVHKIMITETDVKLLNSVSNLNLTHDETVLCYKVLGRVDEILRDEMKSIHPLDSTIERIRTKNRNKIRLGKVLFF